MFKFSNHKINVVVRCVVIIALTVWLFAEVNRMPSPEIASVREQQWAALEQRAQRIHPPEEQQSIEASAKQLLQDRPLDSRSLRILAFIAEKVQSYEQAKLLMQLAVDRSRADAVANAWLLEAHLTEHNWDAALVHLEAALRVYGPILNPLLPAVLFVSQNPTGAEALSQHLKESPPWKNSVHRALQKPQTPGHQLDAFNPPHVVHDVLRTMGTNRENNRCAAAVEGRPPRSKSDRLCSGSPALFVSGPISFQ